MTASKLNLLIQGYKPIFDRTSIIDTLAENRLKKEKKYVKTEKSENQKHLRNNKECVLFQITPTYVKSQGGLKNRLTFEEPSFPFGIRIILPETRKICKYGLHLD